MRTWLLLLALAALAACSPRSSPGNAPPETPPVFDAAPPPPPPYTASTGVRATLEEPASLPGGGAWPARILTAAELAAAMAPIAAADYAAREEAGRRVVDALGTVAFAAPRDAYAAGIGSYDPTSASLLFEGGGFRGLKVDRFILSFQDDPPITIGSLPGPFGGSVSVSGGHLKVRLAMDATAAAAFATRYAATHLEEQYLVRAIAVRQFDDVPYLRAELLGYRLVDPTDHTVYYDSLDPGSSGGP